MIYRIRRLTFFSSQTLRAESIQELAIQIVPTSTTLERLVIIICMELSTSKTAFFRTCFSVVKEQLSLRMTTCQMPFHLKLIIFQIYQDNKTGSFIGKITNTKNWPSCDHSEI
jgi:hypothetical protein